MKTITIKRELPLWILTLLPLVYTISVWPQLPERIPVHYDLHWEANGWAGKEAALLIPGIGIAFYLLLLYLPQIDPKRMSSEFFISNFYKIRAVITVAIAAFGLLLTHLALSTAPARQEVKLIPGFVLLLLAVLGNFMINIKPNWFIGVRTPWTLSSDRVWKQTHLVLGRLWFYGGILCIIGLFTLPDSMALVMMTVFILGTLAFAFAYSYWLYRRDQSGAVREKE